MASLYSGVTIDPALVSAAPFVRSFLPSPRSPADASTGVSKHENRVQVAEELILALAEMQFVAAYWLLYLVPHTQKWPSNVERHVGVVSQAFGLVFRD